jgi:hypothetical protein
MINVIFRKFKKGGDIIALFPYSPYNRFDVNSIESYIHLGQHSEADYNTVIRQTIPCLNSEEYEDLLLELESLGYDDLNIIQKRNLNFAVKKLKENFDY